MARKGRKWELRCLQALSHDWRRITFDNEGPMVRAMRRLVDEGIVEQRMVGIHEELRLRYIPLPDLRK